MSADILVWRDADDSDTIHLGVRRTYKPEKYGTHMILASIQVDSFSNLTGLRATAISVLARGVKVKAELSLTLQKESEHVGRPADAM